MSHYLITKEGFVLKVVVVPGSSKNKIVGLHGDRLKIKIQAPPVDGKANLAIIDFLAKTLKIKKMSLSIVRGETSKSKDVLILEVTKEQLEGLLNPATSKK